MSHVTTVLTSDFSKTGKGLEEGVAGGSSTIKKIVSVQR